MLTARPTCSLCRRTCCRWSIRGPASSRCTIWAICIIRRRTRTADRRYLDWSTRWNARQAAATLADSEATKADLVRAYGAQADKIHVVYLGRDERFGAGDQSAAAGRRSGEVRPGAALLSVCRHPSAPQEPGSRRSSICGDLRGRPETGRRAARAGGKARAGFTTTCLRGSTPRAGRAGDLPRLHPRRRPARAARARRLRSSFRLSTKASASRCSKREGVACPSSPAIHRLCPRSRAMRPCSSIRTTWTPSPRRCTGS